MTGGHRLLWPCGFHKVLVWWCCVVPFSECVRPIHLYLLSLAVVNTGLCFALFQSSWLVIPSVHCIVNIFRRHAIQFLLEVLCLLPCQCAIYYNCLYIAVEVLEFGLGMYVFVVLDDPKYVVGMACFTNVDSFSDHPALLTKLPTYTKLSMSSIGWLSSILGASRVLFIFMFFVYLALFADLFHW